MIIGGSGMSDYLARDIIIWLNSIEISNSTIKKLLAYFPDLRDILDIFLIMKTNLLKIHILITNLKNFLKKNL